MSKSKECPRCHMHLEARAGLGGERRRCPVCGTPLVVASSPSEADVREYLYGQRLIPLSRPLRDGRVRTP